MNHTTPINVVTPNSTQKAVDETSGFYRRPLPFETCVAFESPEGRRLFKESLELGMFYCCVLSMKTTNRLFANSTFPSHFLVLGTMETYFRYVHFMYHYHLKSNAGPILSNPRLESSLAANFVTQADPATCGLGTLSMVLNSLEVCIYIGSRFHHFKEVVSPDTYFSGLGGPRSNLERFLAMVQ